MAIALDGSYATSVGAIGSTKTISSFTVSSNANRYLIVGIGCGNGEPDVTGVTWNSTSLTLLKDSTAAADGGYRTYLYGLVAPASATANIVVTLAGSGNERTSVGAAVYTGVDQTTPIGTAVSALVVGGNPTVDVSSASGELVIDAIGVSLDSTPVVGGGQTERVNVYDGSNCRFGMSEEAGAGTVTMSWTGTTGFDSATCAVPLKPATSGTTFYLTNSTASSSNFGTIQVSGSAPSAATSSTGWTVDTVAASNYALMAWNTERASTSFGGTALPSTSPNNTTGDCFRSATAMTGDFATGTWVITIPVIAVTGASGQDGRVRIRLWKSSNADGSSATEITAGAVTGTTVTDLTTGAEQTSVATTSSITGFSLSAEYLFLQVAWEITGAAT